MWEPSDRYAVVGVGESERSKQSGKTPLHMAIEASEAAIMDSGLERNEIDCILSYQHSDSCDGHSLATNLAIRPTFYMDTFGGGSSTEMLIATAIGLMEAKMCSAALIFRSMNGRSGKRMGMVDENPWDLHGIMEMLIPGGSFVVPYGITSPAQQFAMVANRHMFETGTTEEHLYHVCQNAYDYAQLNPNAILYGKPLTEEAYFTSPYIARPFRIHDCCVETDEANALIVTSTARARSCRQPPVLVRGVSARNCVPNANQYAMGDITDVGGHYAAPQVFDMAAIRPDEIDVAAIYDCFSWVVLAQIEAYGFANRGEAGPFVAEGNLSSRGRLPTNTAGGMCAEGYTHGLNNVIELVRQLRHEYGKSERQIQGCEVGFATGWDGPHAASAMVLRR